MPLTIRLEPDEAALREAADVYDRLRGSDPVMDDEYLAIFEFNAPMLRVFLEADGTHLLVDEAGNPGLGVNALELALEWPEMLEKMERAAPVAKVEPEGRLPRLLRSLSDYSPILRWLAGLRDPVRYEMDLNEGGVCINFERVAEGVRISTRHEPLTAVGTLEDLRRAWVDYVDVLYPMLIEYIPGLAHSQQLKEWLGRSD